MSEERIIGIDLGTTNSLAATVFEDGPEVIGSLDLPPSIPSVVTRKNNEWIVGAEAAAQREVQPTETIYSIKRLMGRGIDEVQKEQHNLPYSLIAAQRQLVKVQLGDQAYTPQEISAQILLKLKRQAEQVLGEPIQKAVITVPAYFDDAQRQATRDAGKLAGLEVVRILNEPTAAAIAYGLEEKTSGYVAVYDLGGGTFDVSILKLSAKVFKVVATHGNTHLGGDDFDHKIAEALIASAQKQNIELPLNDPQFQQQLKVESERVKHELSHSEEANYTLSLPQGGTHTGVLTTDAFNELIHDLIQQTLQSCDAALQQAGIAINDIEEVVLVGGSTVVPYVRKQVEAFFQKPPHIAIDPYKVVAIGAGIQGHLLAGKRRDFLLLDVVPLSLGLETLGGTFNKIIMANSSIPCESSELFTTHVDQQTGIDLNIYQGERELVKDCRCLGQFRLRGIPPMQAGLAKVKVTFNVDANGILTVSAVEERSGQQTKVEVVPFHGLTNYEMDQIMEDSFQHAFDDFHERQLIEFRNTFERVANAIDQHWNAAQQVLAPEQCDAIKRQLQITQQYAQASDPNALKEQMDLLGELTRPLADAIMSQDILEALTES